MPCPSCNQPKSSRPAPEGAKPSQAAHLVRGAASAAKAIVGADRASAELTEQRRAICDDCVESIPRNLPVKMRTCGKLGVRTETTCGCVLVLKTRLKDQSCPQGKW